MSSSLWNLRQSAYSEAGFKRTHRLYSIKNDYVIVWNISSILMFSIVFHFENTEVINELMGNN